MTGLDYLLKTEVEYNLICDVKNTLKNDIILKYCSKAETVERY